MEIGNIQSSGRTMENMPSGDPMGGQMESMGNMDGEQQLMESYNNRGGSMEPQGFNDDTSCVTGCGGSGSGGKRDNRRELNSMCGNVKTWTSQESAQGLDGEVVGLQSSIGYPL